MSQSVLGERIAFSLGQFADVIDTSEGARLQTHCLYPSYDPVYAFIARVGGAFKVHDGGGAFRSAWLHGREEGAIRRILGQQAASYELSVIEDALVGSASDEDWLIPSILAVANASAAAAFNAVTHSAAANEDALRDRIYQALSSFLPPAQITQAWTTVGQSGKSHEFDFGIRLPSDRWMLIDSVSPHHVSIAAKYVAFADTRDGAGSIVAKFAVFDRPLQAEDESLLLTVADVVPFVSLPSGVRREMALH